MNDERAVNAVDKRIGQRVRSRRLEISMSQERLAELLGVTPLEVHRPHRADDARPARVREERVGQRDGARQVDWKRGRDRLGPCIHLSER